MNNSRSRHHLFSTKFISFALSALIFSNNVTFCVQEKSKNIYADTSFSEKYPSAYKMIKFLEKSTVCVGSLVGIYYLFQWGLDKLYPERVNDRLLKLEAKKELKSAQKNILELNMLQNPSASDLKKIEEARTKINDYKSILKEEDNFDYIKSIYGIGGLVAVSKLGYDALCGIGKACESTMYIGALYPTYKRFELMIDSVKELFKTPSKIYTKSEIFSNFDKIFCDLEGQEEAKKGIKNFVYDNAIAKDKAKWDKKKYNHGDILYFHGPSGVGKSFSASYLPYVFSPNPKVFVLSSSDIDKEKKDESVLSQIFSPLSPTNQNSKIAQPSKKSALAEFIKNNPGGFVRIEEYDKLCSPALDEVIRTISETGVINVNGEKIDCSGTTFILTSNEDDLSMSGFDKDSDEKLDDKAIQAGYTRRWHDKSFLNRIRKIKFSKLTSKEYESIIRKRFENISKYWNSPQNGGFKLLIDDISIQKLANKVETINEGARPIDLRIIPECQSLLIQKIKSAPTFDFYKNKEINVEYDENIDSFCLT